ncbi:MAG: hypothetical protein MUE44_07115 [Oscillatoriaceae cyanobacterium Prado104]|jgi:hypothetical protein|nr:hypothetical protein [Oscillatoriaceae cyanobacterium Prado104]
MQYGVIRQQTVDSSWQQAEATPQIDPRADNSGSETGACISKFSIYNKYRRRMISAFLGKFVASRIPRGPRLEFS